MAEEKAAAVEPAEKTPFQVFGSVDLNEKGQVKSNYPSWYFSHLADDLRNEISRITMQLDQDRIPRSEIQLTKERLFQKKEKLKELDQATLELKGKQKDRVAKVYEDLGREIGDRMFTRSDMQKGLADAHEEVKRMTEPCIEVRGDSMLLAKACNVRTIKGKVTREGAAKIWKIAGKVLGEHTNTERLRRD